MASGVGDIEFLHSLISERIYDQDVAAGLYQLLFAPLVPYIDHSNLIIAPHGVLHYLPFAALWDDSDQHYLMQDYAITYVPSASALRFSQEKRNPNQQRLMVMGNPDGTLPNAGGEAQAIAELYNVEALLGEQATEAHFRAHAATQDFLHLAVHGVYDPFNPLFTRVELAHEVERSSEVFDGNLPDGNLEVHEIYGLDLTEANLVVLSACETALGVQSAGDEIVGLTRAFLYAGAPSVVSTLWTVDDAASGALMLSFYHHLQAGQSYAEALRTAQREVMATEGWQEPYYWAAFTLTGDYLGADNSPRDREPHSAPKSPSSLRN